MLLCSLCECPVNRRILPFLIVPFRLTLQSPFIENEDAEIRIRIETRTTDWSMLERCNISDVGECAKSSFIHESLTTHSPQSSISFVGYCKSDPSFGQLPEAVSYTRGFLVPGKILLLFAKDGFHTLTLYHSSLMAR